MSGQDPRLALVRRLCDEFDAARGAGVVYRAEFFAGWVRAVLDSDPDRCAEQVDAGARLLPVLTPEATP